MPTTTSTTPISSRERLGWPDLAKGACILLVVLHHVIVKDYLFRVDAALGPVGDVWHGLTYTFKPVRMPLFFAISGFFAASAVARSWRRIVSGYYLYVLWLGIYWGMYSLEREIPANRVDSVADLFGELLWAASSMWFLYALAIYFVVAKVLRGLPPAMVVSAAAALAMSVSWLGVEENNRFSVLAHLVFFLAGTYYPQVLRRVADLPLRRPAVLGLALLYGAAVVVVYNSPLPRSLTLFGASLIGIPLGIVLAVRYAETRVGRGLAWTGQRTLRIYVLHLAVLVALVQLPLVLGGAGTVGTVVALGYPLAMSALVVASCFAVHRVLRGLGCGWLFSLPVAVDQRLRALGVSSSLVTTGQSVPASGERVPSSAKSGSTE